MDHQRPHYLKLKGKTYYYSRRVPKELQQYSNSTPKQQDSRPVCTQFVEAVQHNRLLC